MVTLNANPEDLFGELVEKTKYLGDVKGKLLEAYQTASKYHAGQKRESGEDYIAHPLSVANILAELETDLPTLQAAILHDTLEDTPLKEEELKELIKQKGLTDKVVFTGFVDEIYEVFNIIDINVISSLSEALCLSLIEGMSVGKPSVAADTGGIPEVIKNGYNGFLVPAGDAEGLADAILKLIHDPGLRKAMGDRGREIMEKSFTAEIMAEKIEELYESVARKNRRE